MFSFNLNKNFPCHQTHFELPSLPPECLDPGLPAGEETEIERGKSREAKGRQDHLN